MASRWDGIGCLCMVSMGPKTPFALFSCSKSLMFGSLCLQCFSFEDCTLHYLHQNTGGKQAADQTTGRLPQPKSPLLSRRGRQGTGRLGRRGGASVGVWRQRGGSDASGGSLGRRVARSQWHGVLSAGRVWGARGVFPSRRTQPQWKGAGPTSRY